MTKMSKMAVFQSRPFHPRQMKVATRNMILHCMGFRLLITVQ